MLVVDRHRARSDQAPEGNPPLKELMEKGAHPYGMQTFEMHLKHIDGGGDHRSRGRACGDGVLSSPTSISDGLFEDRQRFVGEATSTS